MVTSSHGTEQELAKRGITLVSKAGIVMNECPVEVNILQINCTYVIDEITAADKRY